MNGSNSHNHIGNMEKELATRKIIPFAVAFALFIVAATPSTCFTFEESTRLQRAMSHAPDNDLLLPRTTITSDSSPHGLVNMEDRMLVPGYREMPTDSLNVLRHRRFNVKARLMVSQEANFRRGDADVDHELTVSDAIVILAYVYIPGSPTPSCMDALDVSDNGEITMADAIYLLKYLYVPGSPSPPPPFPGCGSDPTPDSLGCDSFSACGGWVGQGQVNEPDLLFDSSARLSSSPAGIPWVVWRGRPADHRMHIYSSKWEGANWGDEMIIAPDTMWEDHVPTIAIDSEGYPLVAWMRETGGLDLYDIYYARWNGSEWVEGGTVHPPHPYKDGGPRMASGGGEVWIIWARLDPDNAWTTEIYASRWNGSLWDPEIMVFGADSSAYPEWKNLTVDQDGIPHVVSSFYPGGQDIFYSTFDGISWTEKERVNLPDTSEADLDPAIAADSLGNLHVVWAARTAGTSYGYEIYYSKHDGVSWSPEIQINDPDTRGDYRPRIAANSPDNIWVSWDGVAGGEYHIYAIQSNGSSWSSETRLDNEETDHDEQPWVTLDLNGDPWVAWTGFLVNNPHLDIFYNKYDRNLLRQR